MKRDDKAESLAASINILKNAGAIIETLQPEMLRSLGNLALHGDTESILEEAEELPDILDSISAVVENIRTALIAFEPAQTPVPEPEDTANAETDAVHPEVISHESTEPATIDVLTPDVTEEARQDILNYFEQGVILYIHQKGQAVHIGEIVRQHIGVDQLDRPDYLKLMHSLNDLAERGFLLHEKGAPWYDVDRTQITTDKDLASDQEPEITLHPGNITDKIADSDQPGSTKLSPSRRAIRLAKRKQFKKEDESSDNGEVEVNRTVLEEILSELHISARDREIAFAVVRSVNPEDWFRQREVDFTGIQFANDLARSQAYGKLMAQLVEAGIFDTEGQRGGKKYRFSKKLILVPSPTQTKKDIPRFTRFYELENLKALPEVTEEDVGPEPVLSPEAQIEQYRSAARFTLSLVSGINEILEKHAEGREVSSVVARNIAARLQVSVEAGKNLVRQLVNAQYFYFDGHKKGVPLLSKDAPDESTSRVSTENSQEEKEAKEAKAAWTELDVKVAAAVLDDLLNFKHVQQGKAIKDLWLDTGLNKEIPEEEYRKSIRRMESRGLIIIDRNSKLSGSAKARRKITQPVVKFPNQESKEEWKHKRKSVLEQISWYTETIMNGPGQG